MGTALALAMGARGRALALMASLLVAFALGAERAAEAKYSPRSNATARNNGTGGKNATKKVSGLVSSKLTSLSLLLDEAAALRSNNATAKVNGTKDSVIMKLTRAQVLVGELEKTAPCLETPTVAKLYAIVDAVDDEVANSNSSGTDGEIEDPMLAKTAKMARIVKFLQSKAQNASCSSGAAPTSTVATVKVQRNRTAEILTLQQYMKKMTKYDSGRFLSLAKNGSKQEMAAVEKAMLAVGVQKSLNSTEKRMKVRSTVKMIADTYGVNNDTGVVDEVSESLYDKPPPPPPPVKPTFPEGFNETMFGFLRNMSAKADKGDVGTVSAEEEDDEALKVSAMMGKLSAAQLKEFAPKLADAQAAVAKEDRRLLALKLKLELACKNKTKADPPKPTVNVSTVVRKLVFNITGRTHLAPKQERELQTELDKVPKDMDKEAVDELETLVRDLKEENRTIEAENNRTLAKNNATKMQEKKAAEEDAKPKSAPLPGPTRAGIFGIFGR